MFELIELWTIRFELDNFSVLLGLDPTRAVTQQPSGWKPAEAICSSTTLVFWWWMKHTRSAVSTTESWQGDVSNGIEWDNNNSNYYYNCNSNINNSDNDDSNNNSNNNNNNNNSNNSNNNSNNNNNNNDDDDDDDDDDDNNDNTPSHQHEILLCLIELWERSPILKQTWGENLWVPGLRYFFA